jgi:hypothetical protein
MESDISLINKVKESKDEASLRELIARHSGIYHEMVNSVIPADSKFISRQDINEEKDYSIYTAALNYDPTRKAKFSTHVGNHARWKCLNAINRSTKYSFIDIDSMKDDVAYTDDGKTLDSIEKKEMLDQIFQLSREYPDKRVARIIELRYLVGQGNKTMSWKNVSKSLNEEGIILSIQGCIDIHAKFIKEAQKSVAQSV